MAAGRRGGVGFSAQLCSAVWHRFPGERGGGDVAGQGRPCAGLTLYFSFLFPPLQPHDIRAQVSAARTQPGAGRSAAGGHCPDRQCRLLLPPPRPGGSPVGKRLGWLARWSFGHREPPCALCRLSPPVTGAAGPCGRAMPAEPGQPGKTKVLGALKCRAVG